MPDGAEVLGLHVLDFLVPGGRWREVDGFVLRKGSLVVGAYGRIWVLRADDYEVYDGVGAGWGVCCCMSDSVPIVLCDVDGECRRSSSKPCVIND